MLGLLQSFTSVLDEFGVSHGRAKRAALCAAEGLMRVRFCLFKHDALQLSGDVDLGHINQAGPELKKYSAASVSEMIMGIQTYNESVQSSKWLVQPIMCLHSTELTKEHVDEVRPSLHATCTRILMISPSNVLLILLAHRLRRRGSQNPRSIRLR